MSPRASSSSTASPSKEEENGYSQDQSDDSGPARHDRLRFRGDHPHHPRKVSDHRYAQAGRQELLRPHHRPASGRRRQAQVPHHRLQAEQGRRARQGLLHRVRPQPLRQHRPDPLRRRREALHHRAPRPEGGRPDRLRRGCRYQGRQHAAPGEHPRGHHDPLRGAGPRQGRSARPVRRQRGPAHRQRERLRPGSSSQR